MERLFRLQVERLSEGVYLGWSDDVQGLVVQGNTVAEVIEYAQDCARILRELSVERGFPAEGGLPIPDKFELPLVLAA